MRLWASRRYRIPDALGPRLECRVVRVDVGECQRLDVRLRFGPFEERRELGRGEPFQTEALAPLVQEPGRQALAHAVTDDAGPTHDGAVHDHHGRVRHRTHANLRVQQGHHRLFALREAAAIQVGSFFDHHHRPAARAQGARHGGPAGSRPNDAHIRRQDDVAIDRLRRQNHRRLASISSSGTTGSAAPRGSTAIRPSHGPSYPTAGQVRGSW